MYYCDPSDTVCRGRLYLVCVLTESRLEKNSIAAFLLLVKNLIRHHPVNQESLLHCHGPSTIGAMLAKVRLGGEAHQNTSAIQHVDTIMVTQTLLCIL